MNRSVHIPIVAAIISDMAVDWDEHAQVLIKLLPSEVTQEFATWVARLNGYLNAQVRTNAGNPEAQTSYIEHTGGDWSTEEATERSNTKP